jgi:hypothetical protein
MRRKSASQTYSYRHVVARVRPEKFVFILLLMTINVYSMVYLYDLNSTYLPSAKPAESHNYRC